MTLPQPTKHSQAEPHQAADRLRAPSSVLLRGDLRPHHDGAYTQLRGNDIYGRHECYFDPLSARGRRSSRGGDIGGPVFQTTNGNVSVLAVGTETGVHHGSGLEELIFQDYGTATRDRPGLTPLT
ncbi:hypothetical protein [Streptosporangium sp. NPDC003464]